MTPTVSDDRIREVMATAYSIKHAAVELGLSERQLGTRVRALGLPRRRPGAPKKMPPVLCAIAAPVCSLPETWPSGACETLHREPRKRG